MSFRYLPELTEAICIVRDQMTGALKLALASNLLTVSYGKDAYLLELQRFPSLVTVEGGIDDV
jgi:hypothetical protein